MKNWQQLLLRVVAIMLLAAGIVFMLPILGYIANGILKVIVKNELVAFFMGLVFAGFGLMVLLGIIGVSKQEKDFGMDEDEYDEEENNDDDREKDEQRPKKKVQKLYGSEELYGAGTSFDETHENAGGWNMN